MEFVTPGRAYAIPLPGDSCPPADNPEAILLWLYWHHLNVALAEPGEHERAYRPTRSRYLLDSALSADTL